mmetsp:Transcript_117679/g.228792  ORF Transcript_117679/g.228792 Transcript_117679/m.228792 type:complete len:556 (-) Transcript_117679:47-1714(-)
MRLHSCTFHLFVLLAFVVFFAPVGCGAIRHKDCGHEHAYGRGCNVSSNQVQTDSGPEECEGITHCYCTLNTPCGWCETTGKALIGSKAGPRSEWCSKWVYQVEDCRTLQCGSYLALGQAANISWFPLLSIILWILTWRWRERLRSKRNSLRGRRDSAEDPTEEDIANEASLEAEEIDMVLREFLQPVRTLEVFKKGLDCPASERLPTESCQPYQLSIHDLAIDSALHLRCIPRHRFFETVVVSLQWRVALGATLRSASTLMMMCSLYVTLLRVAAIFMPSAHYHMVAMMTMEAGALVNSLQTAVSMLLSFYALQRIGWFWSIMQEGFRVQGAAHDIAMLAGAANPPRAERNWNALFCLYRYLVLSFFFAYQSFTPRLQRIKFADLVTCGLLVKDEVELLNGSHRFPLSVLESWLGCWVHQHLQGETRQQCFQALRVYRGALASVSDWVDQRAPVSFETLLYVVVYALCFVMPFGPSHIEYLDRQAVMSAAHVMPVISVSLLTCLYLSLLHLLRHLQAPFDHRSLPCDALNPVKILNSTERKLRDYLTAARPEALN